MFSIPLLEKSSTPISDSNSNYIELSEINSIESSTIPNDILFNKTINDDLSSTPSQNLRPVKENQNIIFINKLLKFKTKTPEVIDNNIKSNIPTPKTYENELTSVINNETEINSIAVNVYEIVSASQTFTEFIPYRNETWNDSFSEFGNNSYDIYNEIPEEMKFNTSHMITICSYATLMILSAVGNISVLRSLAK